MGKSFSNHKKLDSNKDLVLFDDVVIELGGGCPQ